MKRVLGFCLAAWVAAAPVSAAPGDEPIASKAAFEKLKTLEGEWTMEGQPEGAPPMKINYKIVASGSAVIEELFPGTDHSMVSVYYLVGNDLRLTHYCAAKNQPQLKLDRAASSPELLVFAFDGGTNFDPAKDMHMHEGKIAFKEGGKLESAWTGYNGGKATETMVFKLSRP
jgi:hypothetical protein